MISTMIEPIIALAAEPRAAAEAVAAEHGRGQRGDLEADAGVGAGAAQPGREEQTGQSALSVPDTT